jgi:hypothetical protein
VVGIPFDSTITACREFWRSNVQNVGMLIFADAHTIGTASSAGRASVHSQDQFIVACFRRAVRSLIAHIFFQKFRELKQQGCQ